MEDEGEHEVDDEIENEASASADLERLLGLEALLVGGEVPEGRRRQAWSINNINK